MSRLLFFVFFVFLNTIVFSQSVHKKENRQKEAYSKEKKPNKKFELLLELGKIYQKTSIRKADSLKEELVNSSIVLDDSIRLAALIFKAEVELITGDRNSYITTVLGCQPFLNRVSNEAIQLEIYKHLGNYHLLIKEPETADFYLKRMLRTAQSLNSKQAIVN
jgi:hypothetical protein